MIIRCPREIPHGIPSPMRATTSVALQRLVASDYLWLLVRNNVRGKNEEQSGRRLATVKRGIVLKESAHHACFYIPGKPRAPGTSLFWYPGKAGSSGIVRIRVIGISSEFPFKYIHRWGFLGEKSEWVALRRVSHYHLTSPIHLQLKIDRGSKRQRVMPHWWGKSSPAAEVSTSFFFEVW